MCCHRLGNLERKPTPPPEPALSRMMKKPAASKSLKARGKKPQKPDEKPKETPKGSKDLVPQLRDLSSQCVCVREAAFASQLLLVLVPLSAPTSQLDPYTLEDRDTKVATVPFEDMASNAFAVTITRIQQEALKQAGCKVPTPSEQLALVAERRAKKTETTHISI